MAYELLFFLSRLAVEEAMMMPANLFEISVMMSTNTPLPYDLSKHICAYNYLLMHYCV